MSVRVYLHRFTRKFVFDVLPGALASLVGALFFAQQWTQAPMRTEVARVTAQNEQIVTMMRDEQTLLRAVLEREHELAAQRQPPAPAIKDAKDKDKVEKDKAETTATVPARRRVEPPRDTGRAAAVPVAPPPSPTAKPAAERPHVVAQQSGPLMAPEPEPEVGVITRIVSAAVALTHRAANASGVVVPDLMPGARMITGRSDGWPSGHVLDAHR
jgi:hypothetical protein